MHRIIMKAPKDLIVDHINGNKLDNRKDNLRLVTRTQNNWNMSCKNKSCKYKGVYLTNYKYRKYGAKIIVYGKFKYLGSYYTEDEAAIAYNEAAKEYFGEYAKLNKI